MTHCILIKGLSRKNQLKLKKLKEVLSDTKV
jgi:hypothetical protein